MDVADIGYCGLDCESCSVRQYGLGNAKDTLVVCCGNVPESDLKCSGCKSDSVYAGCQICGLRSCAANRKLSHCADCQDFPCSQYKRWGSLARILPHVKDAQINLDIVSRDGLEVWSGIQRSNWSCAKCGTPFSWYSTSCAKCGERLASRTHSLTGLKKLLCKIILPKVYKRGKRIGEP